MYITLLPLQNKGSVKNYTYYVPNIIDAEILFVFVKMTVKTVSNILSHMLLDYTFSSTELDLINKEKKNERLRNDFNILCHKKSNGILDKDREWLKAL